MAATSDPVALPSADDLAWVDYLLGTGAGKLTEIIEELERAFKQDGPELEPMTLERLGGFLLLSREAAGIGAALTGQADTLARLAASLYHSQEDTRKDVVPTVAGVESYASYRNRIAARSTATAGLYADRTTV